MCRVGQNHIYTVYIRYFWQENHQIYGHIRCIYTVLANPEHVYYKATDIYLSSSTSNSSNALLVPMVCLAWSYKPGGQWSASVGGVHTIPAFLFLVSFSSTSVQPSQMIDLCSIATHLSDRLLRCCSGAGRLPWMSYQPDQPTFQVLRFALQLTTDLLPWTVDLSYISPWNPPAKRTVVWLLHRLIMHAILLPFPTLFAWFCSSALCYKCLLYDACKE
jgi:hypothetical protein